MTAQWGEYCSICKHWTTHTCASEKHRCWDIRTCLECGSLRIRSMVQMTQTELVNLEELSQLAPSN